MGRIMQSVVVAVAGVAAAAGIGIAAAPIAQAEPPCLFQGDWDCQGPPQYNGPLLPTWEVPGAYGGWTTNPVQCDVVTRECHQVVTDPYG